MKKILLFLTAGILLLVPRSAQAILIVDTDSGWPQFGVSIYNRSNGDFQINAGQFTLNQSYTISSLETWMYSTSPGSVDLVLYGDKGDLPDPNNEILRQNFDVLAPGPVTDWQGLTGLHQPLNSGSYWISLEKTTTDDNFSVNLPSGAPHPLSHYAYRADEDNNGDWVPYTGGQGFRVGALDGSTAVVPEPATLVLFGTGFLGLMIRSRRKRVPAATTQFGLPLK